MNIQPASLSRIREALRSPKEPNSAHVVADAYWRLLIVCALVVVAFSFWYGYGVFESVTLAGEELSSQQQNQSSAERAKIESVAAGLAARVDSYNTLKTQFASTTDPSR